MTERAKFYSEQVIKIRTRKKMNKSQFSKLLNISKTALNNIESGYVKKPNEKIISRLAEIDNCSYDIMKNRLIYGNDNGPNKPINLTEDLLNNNVRNIYPNFYKNQEDKIKLLIQDTLKKIEISNAIMGLYRRKERGNWIFDYHDELVNNMQIKLSVHYVDRRHIRAYCSWDLLQYQYDYLICNKRTEREIELIFAKAFFTVIKINTLFPIRSFTILFDSKNKHNIETYEYLKKANYCTSKPYCILRIVDPQKLEDETFECKRKN